MLASTSHLSAHGRRRLLVTALAVTAMIAAPAGEAAAAAAGPPPAPRLTTPPAGGVSEAPEGHLVVTWDPTPEAATGDAAASLDGEEPPGDLIYELQTARDPGFEPAKIHPVGAAAASFLSGLRAGDVYVRVRARRQGGGTPGAWSETGIIRVSYPKMRLVTILLILGGVTFLAVVGLILRGHADTVRQTRERARAKASTGAPGGTE